MLPLSLGRLSSRVRELYTSRFVSISLLLRPLMCIQKSTGPGLTKISSAVSDLWSELFDMVSGDLTGGGWSRNGLRDTGLGGGGASSNGDAGEVARLRKGLFEERFRLRPADCWESVRPSVINILERGCADSKKKMKPSKLCSTETARRVESGPEQRPLPNVDARSAAPALVAPATKDNQ